MSRKSGKIKDTARRRRALLRRDGDRCCYCKSQFSDTNPPTIEHVIPRANGGENALTNLRLACGECNHARADRDISHWRFA